MKTRKSIAYAYPTSPAAERLGMGRSGCYYVAVCVARSDGCFWPAPARSGRKGYAQPDDPALVADFHATAGDVCPLFLSHGDKRAVAAVQPQPAAK